MLNSSDPQKRIRRGSDCFCGRRHVVAKPARREEFLIQDQGPKIMIRGGMIAFCRLLSL